MQSRIRPIITLVLSVFIILDIFVFIILVPSAFLNFPLSIQPPEKIILVSVQLVASKMLAYSR